mmetsp:Transcript_65385/g.154890  ORF Transcript_65385/g.154890 Transcript_65385/m.154890 type:complete len:233 (+) Transcript_65385:539-1237(+)
MARRRQRSSTSPSRASAASAAESALRPTSCGVSSSSGRLSSLNPASISSCKSVDATSLSRPSAHTRLMPVAGANATNARAIAASFSAVLPAPSSPRGVLSTARVLLSRRGVVAACFSTCSCFSGVGVRAILLAARVVLPSCVSGVRVRRAVARIRALRSASSRTSCAMRALSAPSSLLLFSAALAASSTRTAAARASSATRTAAAFASAFASAARRPSSSSCATRAFLSPSS